MIRASLLLFLALLAGFNTQPRAPSKEDVKRFRLELHLEAEEGGVYFTAWVDGDVIAAKDGSDGKPVTYRRKFYWSDGCRWEATERLVPTAANRYTYRYREAAVECPDGATPSASVTRSGHVIVHATDTSRPLTPLVAWTAGWDKPQ
jgi:hypothetical protein